MMNIGQAIRNLFSTNDSQSSTSVQSKKLDAETPPTDPIAPDEKITPDHQEMRDHSAGQTLAASKTIQKQHFCETLQSLINDPPIDIRGDWIINPVTATAVYNTHCTESIESMRSSTEPNELHHNQ